MHFHEHLGNGFGIILLVVLVVWVLSSGSDKRKS